MAKGNESAFREEIEKSKIISNIFMNRLRITDIFQGDYKGRPFLECDIYYYYVSSGSNGSTSETRIIKGRYYHTKIPFFVDTKIIIKERFCNSMIGNTEMPFSIDTESIAFSKKFKWDVENQEEALKILKPTVIEGILALEEKHRGKIFLSIMDNDCFLILDDSVDLFELKNNPEERLHQDFKEMISVMDDLEEIFHFVYKKEELGND